MQLRALLAVATGVLAADAAPSAACPPPAPEEVVMELCIDLVCLEGETLDLYLAVEVELGRALRPGLDPEEEVEIVRRSLRLIDELRLDERFRWSLERKLSRAIAERPSPTDRLVLELMKSPALRLQEVALNVLYSYDGPLSSELRSSLLAAVRGPATPADTRQAILWWFHLDGAFEEVEETALDLARGESDPELAHEAARILLENLSGRADGSRRIVELYRSSSSILRSRAALAIVSRGLARDSPTLHQEATRVVGDLAGDSTQPPEARGRAIVALNLHGDAGKQPNRAILLELLDHRHWFFGASGAHFPVHSLALVIEGLSDTGDQEITRALEDLRPLLPALRSGEREYVEWVLDNALGIHREVFHGPVDPERGRS